MRALATALTAELTEDKTPVVDDTFARRTFQLPKPSWPYTYI